MVLGWLGWAWMAQAQVLCDDGAATHASIGQALADPACHELHVGPGVYREEVVIPRSVTLTGAGAASTWLVCDDGPCLSILPGVAFELRNITVAAEGTTLATWQTQLTVEDVVVTRVGQGGGWVRLRDTEARFQRVDIDVAGRTPIQIEALSTRGHDLVFDTARFFGNEPASGTKSAVYTIGYSVECTGCVFLPERERLRPPEPLLDLDDAPTTTGSAGNRAARWPQLSCPPAGEPQRASCRAQCDGDEEVATCLMRWVDASEGCQPVAVCVPAGEAVLDEPFVGPR